MTHHSTHNVNKIAIVVSIILIVFPFLFVIEQELPDFWIAFVEEALIRFLPLLVVYSVYQSLPLSEYIVLGVITGMTYGILEMCVKIIAYGFNILMLFPLYFIHIVNGIVMSVLVGEGIKHRWWVLLPFAWIICSMWHMTWNTTIGFI